MRIILICGAGIVSGKEIMTLHLIKELKRREHQCFVIVSSWGSEDFRNRLREMDIPFYNLRIGFISKKLTWSTFKVTCEQAFYLPGLFLKYRAIHKAVKPSVVIHTNFHHLFLLFPVLSNRNLYWSHEIISDTRFYRKLFKHFRRKIELFIGVSKAVSVSLENLIGREKVVTIRNGVGTSANFETAKAIDGFSRFAIVGQISKNKGHDFLFKSIAGLRTGSRKIHLKIIGSGDPVYLEYLHALASDLGLTDYIEWNGFIKDPDEIYKNIDWIIVPTINPEPLGLIVMEAAMRGIPAIASNSGGLPELIEDGVNGFLFVAGDLDSLQNSIQKALLLTDNTLMRKKTLQFANDNFTLTEFGAKYDQVINA